MSYNYMFINYCYIKILYFLLYCLVLISDFSNCVCVINQKKVFLRSFYLQPSESSIFYTDTKLSLAPVTITTECGSPAPQLSPRNPVFRTDSQSRHNKLMTSSTPAPDSNGGHVPPIPPKRATSNPSTPVGSMTLSVLSSNPLVGTIGSPSTGSPMSPAVPSPRSRYNTGASRFEFTAGRAGSPGPSGMGAYSSPPPVPTRRPSTKVKTLDLEDYNDGDQCWRGYLSSPRVTNQQTVQ